jgi:hypothetical protein
MPAFEVTPTAPQQQLSPRKASVATSATNSVAASNALKPVVVSLPASESNKLAAAARGGGGGCKGSGVRAQKKSSASSVSSQSSSSGVIAPPPQSGGQQQQSAKLSVPSFLPQPQSQHSPIPGLPQAVSRDPFHFPLLSLVLPTQQQEGERFIWLLATVMWTAVGRLETHLPQWQQVY